MEKILRSAQDDRRIGVILSGAKDLLRSDWEQYHNDTD